METDECAVESEVQIFGQKVCQICNEANCWGEHTHEQPEEDKDRDGLEDFALKTKRTAQ